MTVPGGSCHLPGARLRQPAIQLPRYRPQPRDLSRAPRLITPSAGSGCCEQGLQSGALRGDLVTTPSGGTSDTPGPGTASVSPDGMAVTVHQLRGLGWLLFTVVDTPQAALLGSCPPISTPLCAPRHLNAAGTPDLLLTLGSGEGGGLGRCERGPHSVDCEFTKGHQLGAWPSRMGVARSGGRGQARWVWPEQVAL